MYKIIYNDKVIDVIKYPKFVRFLRTGHVSLTDKTSAQGLVGSDDVTVYSFFPGKNHKVVTAVEINLNEFERLKSLLNSGEEISADDSALANAKRSKIANLSSICKNKITAGFQLELSDGKSYGFKLSSEDQLNLMQIESQLAAGGTSFIYHATNQPCKVYTRDDMELIVRAFRKHVLYHTTYFNTAKQYVNSLLDIEKVKLFNYGIDISGSVEDKVLKQILKNGGA